MPTARAATSQQAAPASLFCSLRAGVRSRRPLTSCRCCGRTLCAGATYQRRPRVRRMNRVAEARMRLAGTSIVNVFVAVIAGRWLHATSSTITRPRIRLRQIAAPPRLDMLRRIAAPPQPRADTSPSYRGAAAAGYVSGESRIRRGWKCLRRIAAPPRPRRLYVSGKSRRRRGRDEDTSPLNRGVAAAGYVLCRSVAALRSMERAARRARSSEVFGTS